MKIQPYRPPAATGFKLAGVFLLIFALIAPAGANTAAGPPKDYSLRVILQEPLKVAIRNLPVYFRAATPEPAVKIDPSQSNDTRVNLEPGKSFEAIIRTDKPGIELAAPYQAPLNAEIFLGKTVAIESIATASLKDKTLVLTVTKKEPRLAVGPDGSITCRPKDCREYDDVAEVAFPRGAVNALAPRPGGMQPIRTQSFELLDGWVSAGEDVRIEVPIPDLNTQDSRLMVGFWTDSNKAKMEDFAVKADITGIESDPGGQGIYIIRARVPYLEELMHVEPQWYLPIPPLVKMTVSVRPGQGREVVSETFDLRFSRRGWGIAAGLFFIFLVFLLVMIISRDFNPFEPGSTRHTLWRNTYKSNRFVRFFFSPMDIAVTPFGTYSISVTQALYWTFIVAFSCVYVYMLKAAFIAIPPQILLLLGISGGTALASRINSTSRDVVPKELMIDMQRSDIPRLRDMISIAGRLNIYKFQMMVFTVITGIIVLVELIKASNFPEIPDSLIALMGLSNTLYLGNEVTVEPVQGLRDKVKAYKDEADPTKKAAIGEEIKSMLDQY
jgi:hypothetical protein